MHKYIRINNELERCVWRWTGFFGGGGGGGGGVFSLHG